MPSHKKYRWLFNKSTSSFFFSFPPPFFFYYCPLKIHVNSITDYKLRQQPFSLFPAWIQSKTAPSRKLHYLKQQLLSSTAAQHRAGSQTLPPAHGTGRLGRLLTQPELAQPREEPVSPAQSRRLRRKRSPREGDFRPTCPSGGTRPRPPHLDEVTVRAAPTWGGGGRATRRPCRAPHISNPDPADALPTPLPRFHSARLPTRPRPQLPQAPRRAGKSTRPRPRPSLTHSATPNSSAPAQSAPSCSQHQHTAPGRALFRGGAGPREPWTPLRSRPAAGSALQVARGRRTVIEAPSSRKVSRQKAAGGASEEPGPSWSRTALFATVKPPMHGAATDRFITRSRFCQRARAEWGCTWGRPYRRPGQAVRKTPCLLKQRKAWGGGAPCRCGERLSAQEKSQPERNVLVSGRKEPP